MKIRPKYEDPSKKEDLEDCFNRENIANSKDVPSSGKSDVLNPAFDPPINDLYKPYTRKG